MKEIKLEFHESFKNFDQGKYFNFISMWHTEISRVQNHPEAPKKILVNPQLKCLCHAQFVWLILLRMNHHNFPKMVHKHCLHASRFTLVFKLKVLPSCVLLMVAILPHPMKLSFVAPLLSPLSLPSVLITKIIVVIISHFWPTLYFFLSLFDIGLSALLDLM